MKLPLLILFATAMISCSKKNIENGITNCLDTKISAFNKSSICNDAKVDKYVFYGDTVYTFDPGTCGADMTTEVIGMDCKSLGYLGGIIGNTQINGKEFSSAIFVKNVWKK